MQLLTADGAKDARSVTVADGSIFAEGQLVLLDEDFAGAYAALTLSALRYFHLL